MYLRDNIDFFNEYDAKQARELARLPKCTECGEHITEEYCFEFDGDLICVGCLKQNHRKWVEDCVE